MASLFKKSKDKIKSGESVIGKIIYIFLLFAPLFSILTTCFYVMFNKNAYESYYGETINEEQYEYLQANETPNSTSRYYLDLNKPISQTNSNMRIKNMKLEENGNLTESLINTFNTYQDSIYLLEFRNEQAGETMVVYRMEGTTNTWTASINIDNYKFILSFNYISANNLTKSTNLYTITHNKYSFLDNAFDYSLYKVEENNVFNWSKTTGMYQVLETTCNGLGITNTFTPMLLSYWLIISVIYFIYDIALMLVWIMHRKIHELQESI